MWHRPVREMSDDASGAMRQRGWVAFVWRLLHVCPDSSEVHLGRHRAQQREHLILSDNAVTGWVGWRIAAPHDIGCHLIRWPGYPLIARDRARLGSTVDGGGPKRPTPL